MFLEQECQSSIWPSNEYRYQLLSDFFFCQLCDVSCALFVKKEKPALAIKCFSPSKVATGILNVTALSFHRPGKMGRS